MPWWRHPAQVVNKRMKSVRSSGISENQKTQTSDIEGIMDAKILIVEDDPDTLNGLCIRLKASGYALVPPATSAASAKKLVPSSLPDLIILDLGLPDGDGYTVLEELKSSPETDSIPVIVLTGRDSEGNQERSYAQGTFDFFQKPVRYEWLLASIEKALAQGTARNTGSREQGAESST